MRLLHAHQVTVVADIRSVPYSRQTPQFNREQLKSDLERSGISYVYLGIELGARPTDLACYKDGRVSYELLAKTALFRSGLQKIIADSRKHQIALLCVEKDPLECPRSLLVARELEAASVQVFHILGDSSTESQGGAMNRLLARLRMDEKDLFRTKDELIEDACQRQEQRIAYVKSQ